MTRTRSRFLAAMAIPVWLLVCIPPAILAQDSGQTLQRNRGRSGLSPHPDPQLGDLSLAPDPRLGLGFPSQDVTHYSPIPQCGMGMVRLTVHWAEREPAQGEYYWGGLDNKVRVLQKLGADLVFTIQSDALWATESTEYIAANRPPLDMAVWTDFIAQLVDRYDADGVNDMRGLERPVLCYQVASEWPSVNNLHGGWTGTIDQLIDFFNATYDAVKVADPTAGVILGGISAIGLDAMVLNAGMGNYVARRTYSETAKDTLTVELAQDPRVFAAVADRERVFAESRYDMVDLHMYGPVEFNQYRIDRIRQSVGTVPLVSLECGGPNLGYDPLITHDEHFLTALDMTLDGLSRGMTFMMWLSMFGQEYDPDIGPTWGNSQLQLIDKYGHPTGGFWAYHLLAAMLDGASGVEKPGPGIYIIHRPERSDIHVVWRADGNDSYQLPADLGATWMMEVTNARYGFYRLDEVPADGLLALQPLPLVISPELPGLATAPVSPVTGTLPGPGLQLAGTHPNPFNPRTTIEFSLQRAGHVQVSVFDLKGHRVDTLLDDDLPAGPHRVMWDAHGQPSGTYCYRITGAGMTIMGRCQLVK